VVHTSDLVYHLRDEIAALSTIRLVNAKTGEPLKAVEHVGCHYAKIFPSGGFGGAEFPYVLSGLIESWGATVIDYPERRHCCGFGFRHYLLRENRGYSVSNSKIKFESMAPYEPDFILTNCPGCNMFMDRWQYTLSEMEGKTYDKNGFGIPVLSHEELAAIILGMNPWEIGLQMHQVQSESLLDKIGYKYSKKEKFYLSGKPVSPAQQPSILLV
jgi:heterodisulfide reductase subunit B